MPVRGVLSGSDGRLGSVRRRVGVIVVLAAAAVLSGVVCGQADADGRAGVGLQGVRGSAAERQGAGEGGECLQLGVGGGKLPGPRPVLGEPKDRSAGVTGDSPGLVLQPVAQSFQLPRACGLGQAQLLGPRDQVLGEHHQPDPYLVVSELAEREVTQSAVLALADLVLNAGVTAMVKVQLRDGSGPAGW